MEIGYRKSKASWGDVLRPGRHDREQAKAQDRVRREYEAWLREALDLERFV